MENIRDSTTVPQIVKIVRMVVKFHPLLTMTSFVYQVIYLQHWIEEEVSNQWNILEVHCQSTMRAVRDLITKKMKNLSEALKMHLNDDAAKGQLKAQLIGKLALFFATSLMLDTEFSSKYDKSGAKTQLLLSVGLHLLTRTKLWSQLRILRERYSCMTNSTSNFTFFILAIVFTKFYDNSLRTISVLLFIVVFCLCLLVVLRPRTDFGLVSFIIGVIGAITYNRFEFTFPSWIIASICFMLFSFKSWLDKYWLDLEQDRSTGSIGISLILILSLAAIQVAQPFFAFSSIISPLPNYKDLLVMVIARVIGSVRFLLYLKNNSVPSTDTKGISGLILTVVNVAQGMLVFIFTIFPITNFKYWLFAVISYVVFSWLCKFLPQNLSPSSTNVGGITGLILSLQSIALGDVAAHYGFDTSMCFSDWLVGSICYALWSIRLHAIISKRSLTSNHN